MDTEDRRKFLSVAVSFRDLDRLNELGFPPVEVACPKCSHTGVCLGDPDDDFRLEGFTAVSAGGIAGLVAQCEKCEAQVVVRHRAD